MNGRYRHQHEPLDWPDALRERPSLEPWTLAEVSWTKGTRLTTDFLLLIRATGVGSNVYYKATPIVKEKH